MTGSGGFEVRLQRAAVGTFFFALGGAVGSWVSRIPEVQSALKIGEGTLGVALLMSAVGGLIAMPLAGALAPRVGTRNLATLASLMMCVMLPMIAVAPKAWVLMIILGVYGASTGVMGVTINALAVHVEGLVGRPILSSFHALFSLGCLVGAGIASRLVELGISPLTSLGGAGVVLGMSILIALVKLPTASAGSKTKGLKRPPLGLVILGALAFLAFVGEGSMADWSALYLQKSLAATPSVAALGFAAYSLGMTTVRFMGDRLTRILGDEAVIRGGAGLAAVGLACALILRHPTAAIVGFSLVGAGLANVVPILFRAASRVQGIAPVVGIATASTVGYFGFLTGPPVIGMVAEGSSLTIALGIVTIAIACVAAAGGVVRNEKPPRGIDPDYDPSVIDPAPREANVPAASEVS